MDSLLPFVNAEIGHSVAQDMCKESDRAFVVKELLTLEKKNPVIAEFITKWSKKIKAPSTLHCAFCGILVYKLLESQAEANQMKEEIRLE